MNNNETLPTDSLLEVAIKLLKSKKKPKKLKDIIKETMQRKGLTVDEAKDLIPQFILDFQTSGYFVYLGDDEWDLKERQSVDKLDKIEKDNIIEEEENDEVKENELKDDEENEGTESEDEEENDDDDDNKDDDDDDDLEEALKSTKKNKQLDDDEYDENDDFYEFDEESELD